MFVALVLAVVLVAVLIARARLWPAATGDGISTGDWAFVGVRLFTWVAGIALALAGVLFVSSSSKAGWPLAIAGLVAGAALVGVSELLHGKHPVTANALAGAGIATLYATFFAMHARWQLVPLVVALIGVLLVTAAAVYLSTRRHSIFIALIGLLGGFATPALLSSLDNAYTLFLYLLLLNIGIAVVAQREGWPLLTALALLFTTLYQWAWVIQSMRVRQLALGAVIFIVFAALGAAALWFRWPRPFQKIAVAAVLLPLFFAFYVASQPDYGTQVYTLFGFLLVMAAGLFALAQRSGYWWLHLAGGIATLVTWAIWLRESYSVQVWPWALFCLALFIVLYTVRLTFIAPLLFLAFIFLAEREWKHGLMLLVVMLSLVALVVYVSIRSKRPYIALLTIAIASTAVMAEHPKMVWLVLAHALLFAAFFIVAWTFSRPLWALLAIPFYVAMVITAYSPATAKLQFLVALAPLALFVAYAYVTRATPAVIAAVLAALVFFLAAFPTLPAGLLLLALAAVLFVLAWRVRMGFILNVALLFLNAAIPLLFVKEAVVILWALEAVALLWVYKLTNLRALLLWSIGLTAAVFFWLAIDADFYGSNVLNWIVYAVCVGAFFFAAWLAKTMRAVTLFYSLAGLVLSWFRVNIEIANYYHSTLGAAPFEFNGVSAREDITYTIAWAVIATGLLFIGLKFDWHGARVGATGLLLAAIAKCFLHDLTWLQGSYRLTSLVVLAASLLVVGLMLQRYVTPRAQRLEPAPR